MGLPFRGYDHPTSDTIECYSMGWLQGQELEEIEEHLLVCKDCQSRVEAEDAFTQGIRFAGRALTQPPSAARRPLVLGWRWGYVAAAAALLILILAGSRWPPLRQAGPPAIVVLESTRGAQTRTVAARQPLILVMDVTGLPQLAEYELEVVDASGQAIFQALGTRQNNQVRGKLAHGLPRGAYFARLYARGGDMLREFALTVNP